MTSTNADHSADLHHNSPVPLIVVDHVALFISDTLIGHFFDELATRNPKKRVVPPNPHRKDLLSMCLVYRTWTPVVKRILRKRVRIHTPDRLMRFLAYPDSGQWVVELWYIHDMTPSKKKTKSPVVVSGKQGHWHQLAELLSRLRNLRFLSVELVDRSGAHYNPKEADGIVDPFDKASREERIDCAGVRDALAAIGKLSDLEGLVLVCDAFRVAHGRHGEFKSSRYFPFFIQACQQLPKLTNLKYLHIRGWGGWHDPVADIQIDGGNLDEVEMPQMDQEPMSESLVGKTPPASLKTLVLEVPHYRSPFNHIKWLQHPQGDYNPQNLFLRFNEDCEPMYAIEWSMMWKDTALSPSPSLENVRLEFPDPCNQDNGDEIDVGPSVRKAISRLVMAQLTGARTLHAAPIFLDAPFPSTLEDLRIVFESTSRSEPEWAHEVAWGRRDSALEDLIRGLKSRGAHRKIVVTVTEEGDDEGYFDERDYDDIEDYLGCTIEFCGDNGIELYKAEEKDVRGRIHDFLLYGQVQ